MTPDEEPFDPTERLQEVERRLRSILELASSEVVGGATAEEKLEDAERRLNRIYDLALGDESQP